MSVEMSEGGNPSVEGGRSASCLAILIVFCGWIKNALTSEKAKRAFSLVTVAVLVLPITQQLLQDDVRIYDVDELPVEITWTNGDVNQTVIIHIIDIGPMANHDRVTLVVTFNYTSGVYPNVLFVNGESYGFIEYKYTIFTILATGEVILEFGAKDLWVRLDVLGEDGIVQNEFDDVVVKGKTYWEEYQRYWSGQYWGHRSIVSLPEPPPMFPPRHSVNVTSPDGVTLKHMAVNGDGIYDYSYLSYGYRNVTLRSDTTFFKVWTNGSNFYRLQFNWMQYESPSAKVKHADLGFGVGGGTRAGGEGPIELSDDSPDEGDLVEIQVMIVNTGDAGSSQFNTTVYLDRINGSTLIGNNITELGPWQNKTVTFEWDTNGTFGNHTIRAILDQDNYVWEWNESNHASTEVFVNSTKLYQDADNDTLPDAWEDAWGLNKSDATGDNGKYGDPDQDGLHNRAEYENNTLPLISDTDNDTLLDGDNNTLVLLKLVGLEEKAEFDDHRFYLMVSRFETSEGDDIPYGGYRIPTQYGEYFNTSAGQPNENVSKSYIVKNMPIEVYNRGNSTVIGTFYITADKENLSSSSETPFDFENDLIKIRVNASLIMNATSDPDPLVKDADWDGLDDAWEMVYLDTKAIDFREVDSDGDGVKDILDVDSDDDHRTDGGDVRLFFFPIYEQEEYDYPLVQVGVKSSNQALPNFGYRYPEFGINQSSPIMTDIGMTDPADEDVDEDGLLDGDEERLWGSNPLSSDTDADGLDDAMEVQLWFTYEEVTLDKLFFDNEGMTQLNLTGYYQAHFKATIYAEVRTNVTTEEDIPDSLVIEVVEENELMSTITELDYTTFYDSNGLDDDYTKIPVMYNFSFDNLDGESTWIYMRPNPEVFPENLGEFEAYLDYVVVKILGSDVASGDTDGDGLSDYDEISIGTSISKMDTDSDRITDNAERIFWFGIIGMPDYEEAVVLRDADVDDDGLLDGYEVLYGTDPEEADEDNDLLLDNEEVLAFVTAMRHNLTNPTQNPPLENEGTFTHEFALSAKGDYYFRLNIVNMINRSIDYYDEDLIYEEDYMERMNTWFMNNSSVVQYCHDPWMASEYCEEVGYDSRAIIVNVTRYENYVNTSEERDIFIFENISEPSSGFGMGAGYDIYKVKYELDVPEVGTDVLANFTVFLASRRGVHPFRPDFDGDGLLDGIEVNRGSNPFYMHSDEDMLTDYDEFMGTYGALTNLTDEDTDNDGLWDGYNRGTGLSILHYGELTFGTNGTNPDTDGDGLFDGFEVGLGTTPTLWDSDGDSMADGWEYHYDLDPVNQDGTYDYDSDGLNNSQEFVTDTDPKDEDIDDDLLKDGEELYGVLFRTNVTDGAQSIQNYESQEGYKWIFYNSTSHKKYQYNDQSADTWWVVCDNGDIQNYSRIWGDYIVWEDTRNGDYDIYYFNISSETEVRVTDETAEQRYPDIYGDIIVWQDKRNPGADWDIWAYNITSDEEFRITDDESAQTHPAIYGNTIVWVDERNGDEGNGYQTEIYMYDLNNEYEARITNDSHNQKDPRMYENSVVWLDDNYSSWDVYLHQPSGSRYLVNDSAEQRNPQIHGIYVVWEDYRDGNWEIYLHDLKLDSETRITNVESEQSNVAMYGDKILWVDFRDGNAEIYLYNITTKVRVKITDDSAAQTGPAIYENRFVWTDSREGNDDIYLYDLEQFGSLGDGAPLFYNPVREEIYVWEQNSTFYRFNETDASEPCTITVPTIGYRNMEIYEGPNIRHPDSDLDGLLDGRNTTVDKGSNMYDYYLSYELPFIDNGDGTVTFVGEKSVFTNPIHPDSDFDLLKDAKEVFGYNISVKRANGSVEKMFVYTNPANDDCDNDGLIDGREPSFQTDPNHPDADDDDLIDGYNVTTPMTSELFTYFTGLGIQYKNNGDGTATFVGELSMGASPTSADSDGDGLPDGQEVFVNGTHPAYVDTEGDGLPDGYESYYGLSLLSDDADSDFDEDDFTNIHEYLYGTHPRSCDTDSDGLPDAWEFEYGLSPLDDGTDAYQRDHDASTNTWSYTVLEDQGVADNGPDADVDEDGLSNEQEYSYMKPADWDEDEDGPWWDGLPPIEADADEDTILDGAEFTQRTYWWEAENYTENDPVDDSSNGASGGYAASATSTNDEVFEIQWNLPSDDPDPHWKVLVKARKIGTGDGSLDVYEGETKLGTLTIDESNYDWYSLQDLEFDKEGDVTVKGIDGETTTPSLYVDKVVLLNVSYLYVDEICGSVSSQCSSGMTVQFPAGGGYKTVYVRIPVGGGIPRYVVRAYISTYGDDADPSLAPNLSVGDKVDYLGHQWHFEDPNDWYYRESDSNTSLDLSGEFNQFIFNNTDADDGSEDDHISIPLVFQAGNNGKLHIDSIYVLLWPFISDPNDVDTDSDDLLDWEEVRTHNTSSLRTDSDNDYIADWSEVNAEEATDPVDSDTDDDELPDIEDESPTTADGDDDGLLDGQEFRLRTKTDDPDTDDDHLLDGYNITMSNTSQAFSSFFTTHSILWVYLGNDEFTFLGEMSLGTKPTVADTDGDELDDGEEWVDGTSYLNFDTDFDGLLDGTDLTVQESDERYQLFVNRGIVYDGPSGKFKGEDTAGSDPKMMDSDFDQMPDGWEVKFGLSPTDNGTVDVDDGPDGDPDEDGVANIEELSYQTNPSSDDTDGDDLLDGWEITYGLDPLHDGTHKFILKKNYDYDTADEISCGDGASGDPDLDEIDNYDEQSQGTSPTSADSDGDGLLDGQGFSVTTSGAKYNLWWNAQGIAHKVINEWHVEFLGESLESTNPLNPDCDGDNITDGQELLGYNVTIMWYEGEELKSQNKTVFGSPWGYYKEPNNSTLLDVDEDGIKDVYEIDPVNVTDYRPVQDFVELFGDNQTMLDNQFNPFMRENSPPLVIGITIKKYDEWGWCHGIIDHKCRKAAYTRIWVDVIDVSPYTITIKINNDDDRSRTFETFGGREDFHTSFDLSGWEIETEYKVTVEMVDFTGNELDPKYEQVIRGFLGEIAKRLGDLWDAICGVVGAVADAVMKALSFIVDILIDMANWVIEGIFEPILELIEGWGRSVVGILGVVLALPNDASAATIDSYAGQLRDAIMGPGLWMCIGIAVALGALFAFLSPFLLPLAFLGPLIASLITLALIATLGVEDPTEDSDPIEEAQSMGLPEYGSQGGSLASIVTIATPAPMQTGPSDSHKALASILFSAFALFFGIVGISPEDVFGVTGVVISLITIFLSSVAPTLAFYMTGNEMLAYEWLCTSLELTGLALGLITALSGLWGNPFWPMGVIAIVFDLIAMALYWVL